MCHHTEAKKQLTGQLPPHHSQSVTVPLLLYFSILPPIYQAILFTGRLVVTIT